MSFTKPSNLSATKAYQAVAAAAADITFAAGAIGFVGVGETAKIINIRAQSTKAFSAGTKQVNTLDYTAVVATDNTVYTLAVRRFDTNQVVTYQIITGTGTTTATIAEQFRASITNDLSAVFIATRAGSVLTVTEVNVSTKGLAYVVTTGVVNTNTVVHVDESGTLAEVQVYDPTVTAGDYRRYNITYDKEVAAPNGGKWFSEVIMVIWANTLDAANEAAFLAKFNEVMTASNVVAATQPYVEVV